MSNILAAGSFTALGLIGYGIYRAGSYLNEINGIKPSAKEQKLLNSLTKIAKHQQPDCRKAQYTGQCSVKMFDCGICGKALCAIHMKEHVNIHDSIFNSVNARKR